MMIPEGREPPRTSTRQRLLLHPALHVIPTILRGVQCYTASCSRARKSSTTRTNQPSSGLQSPQAPGSAAPAWQSHPGSAIYESGGGKRGVRIRACIGRGVWASQARRQAEPRRGDWSGERTCMLTNCQPDEALKPHRMDMCDVVAVPQRYRTLLSASTSGSRMASYGDELIKCQPWGQQSSTPSTLSW